MRGCCGAERQKFKTEDGRIDQERLTTIQDKRRLAGGMNIRLSG